MSKIQHHRQLVSKTAHYYSIGEASLKTKYFLITCHGYAQLAKHFIRRFDLIATEKTFIIAPEGLSRFYWKGVTGEVAASWMTKEDRLDEIEDYCNFIQSLYDKYVPQLAPDVQIILFGFSQGCATQCRWIMKKSPHFHRLILWGGLFPEDLDYLPKKEYFSDKKIHHVYGNQDQYLTPKRLEMHEDLLSLNALKVQPHTFEGKHEVDRNVLKQIYTNIIETEDEKHV